VAGVRTVLVLEHSGRSAYGTGAGTQWQECIRYWCYWYEQACCRGHMMQYVLDGSNAALVHSLLGAQLRLVFNLLWTIVITK
jgi:hypothetical protein